MLNFTWIPKSIGLQLHSLNIVEQYGIHCPFRGLKLIFVEFETQMEYIMLPLQQVLRIFSLSRAGVGYVDRRMYRLTFSRMRSNFTNSEKKFSTSTRKMKVSSRRKKNRFQNPNPKKVFGFSLSKWGTLNGDTHSSQCSAWESGKSRIFRHSW